MVYHQKDQFVIIAVTEGEEREKGVENLIREIMLRSSQIWGEIWISKFMKLIGD